MAGTGFAETTPYGNLECGRAKSPDGESTRGKAKFGKRHGSRKWEKRTPQHEGVTEGRGENGRKPLPPYNVPHTPLSIRRAGCFLLLCISQTPEMHPRPFFGGFWHAQWSSQGFSRIRRGIRRHPRVRWQICESIWLVFRTLPCDVAA